jgi:hypothetical protein
MGMGISISISELYCMVPSISGNGALEITVGF